MPAMLELRIRACHVRGSFVCKDNVAPARLDASSTMAEPARFDYARLAHPPVDLRAREAEDRRAHSGGAALHRRARAERAASPATHGDVGIDRAGRPLQRAGARAAAARPGRRVRRERAADAGAQRHLSARARRDHRVLPPASARCWWSRRASPSTSSATSSPRCIAPACRRALHGKDLLPMAGEYTVEVMAARAGALRRAARCRSIDVSAGARLARRQRGSAAARSRDAARRALPARPPSFCVGCPERPVFAALKLAQQDVGPVARRRRHRLPRVRDLRAVLVGPLDPRLRHEPGERAPASRR